jgi:hypothetical protein
VEKQLKAHEKFINNNKYIENRILFKSRYSPLISVDLTKKEILKIAKDIYVEDISLKKDIKWQSTAANSVNVIRANIVRDDLGYTGTGIRIGQFEPGMPDESKSYFNAANIAYDPSVPAYYHNPNDAKMPSDDAGEITGFINHANLVASIMVAKSHTFN